MAELTASERARISSTNVTHAQKIAGCVDCEERAPVKAIILYPNLGTPLILEPGQTKCSIFIAAESTAKDYFGIVEPKELRPTTHYGVIVKQAKFGPVFVDRHLRLYPINAKTAAKEPKDTMLFADGKAASLAMEAVRVWHVGAFRGGLMINRDGEPMANIRSDTVARYSGLTDVYEIEIDLAKLPRKPDLKATHTFAWMVPVPEKYAKRPELKNVAMWEYQDQVILDFLDTQKADPNQKHYPELYEFDLAAPLTATTLPRQKSDSVGRLAAWHPVIRGKADTLRIGHLSDVHVNVRHRALAKSDVAVIEQNGMPRTGTRATANLCDSLNALTDLVTQFSEKADALVITGDLLDFNRNLDPGAVTSASPASQWKQFNVLNKISDGSLYKRGLDDMLVYSLLRHAYRELNLPVFLTTGNHEAYAVPYGVSPRMNNRAFAMTALEAAGAIKGPHGKREVDKKKLNPASILTSPLGGNIAINEATKSFESAEDASKFATTKANDGIAADHNLTIYEICLAYGPTYAQLLTAMENFTPANYDWFFTLFTPLSDWRTTYGKQCLVGLDWGAGENLVNAGGLLSYDYPSRSDKQGAPVSLPRAPEAMSRNQLLLVSAGQRCKGRNKGSLVVFSHFTMINYDMKIALGDSGRRLVPSDSTRDRTFSQIGNNSGGWNDNNIGTCEQGLRWYFDNCVNEKDYGVDYHFSGHSHRQGIYTTEKGGQEFRIVSAFDPGMQPNAVNNARLPRTRFIVSSCGGPIGVQNLDHELGGWTLTPPSGTLLDPKADKPFQQVFTHKGNGQPRLAVALDYLHVSAKEVPIRWEHRKANVFYLIVGPMTQKLDCIAGIRLWGFKTKKGVPSGGQWISFDTTLKYMRLASGMSYETPAAIPSSGVHEMSFPPNRLAELAAMSTADTTRWFCEVALKAPKGFASDHFKLDPWLFPVDFGDRMTGIGPVPTLIRRGGEQGEVPDWKWLNETFDSVRYLPANKIIARELK